MTCVFIPARAECVQRLRRGSVHRLSWETKVPSEIPSPDATSPFFAVVTGHLLHPSKLRQTRCMATRIGPAVVLLSSAFACQSSGGDTPSETTGDTSSEVTSQATSTTSHVSTVSTPSSTSTATNAMTTTAPVTSTGVGPTTSHATTTAVTSSAVTPESDTSDGSSSSDEVSNPVTEASSEGTSSSAEETSAAEDGCGAALLCDDFDDDTVGMAPGEPWSVDVNGGGVEISTERAFSGDKSVHVSNTQGAYKRAYFAVDGDPVFPAAGAEMFGRMMMWLEATPAGSVHWTFIQGEGPSDDGSFDIFYRYGGQHEGKLMANFETQGKATDCWDHSATEMPTQTWACLEWRFNVATDEMQFWLDGAEIADIHTTGMGEGCGSQDLNGAWPAPAQFEVLRLGWEKYSGVGRAQCVDRRCGRKY